MKYLIKLRMQYILIILLSCCNQNSQKKDYDTKCMNARLMFLLGLQNKDNNTLDERTQGRYTGLYYASLPQLAECSKPVDRIYSVGGEQFGPKNY